MSLSSLQCIFDCSGSMAEYGKPMLMVNLLRFVRQFAAEQEKELQFYTWQSDIQPVSWHASEDVALPSLSGSSSAAALCSWCEANSTIEIVVLTDGYLDLDNEQRNLLAQLKNLRFIAVGGDSDVSLLKSIATNSFPAEQIGFALFSIEQQAKGLVIPPLKRVDLEVEQGISQDDEDDDWD